MDKIICFCMYDGGVLYMWFWFVLGFVSLWWLELLVQIGICLDEICLVDIDEILYCVEDVCIYIVWMVWEKVQVFVGVDGVVLCVDILVMVGWCILGKFVDVDEVWVFLCLLLGCRYCVLILVVLCYGDYLCECLVEIIICLCFLLVVEIEDYIVLG